MEPAPNVDGSRWYACGPGCPRPAVAAIPIEQDLIIRAMVRAYVVLYQVGRTPGEEPAVAAPWGAVGQLDVTAAERMRWSHCDVTDRRSLLRTAYEQVLVDEDGHAYPVWWHEQAGQPTGARP